jgi:hypothetical protein
MSAGSWRARFMAIVTICMCSENTFARPALLRLVSCRRRWCHRTCRPCAGAGSHFPPRTLWSFEGAAEVLPSAENYGRGSQRRSGDVAGIPSGRCSPVDHLGRGPSHAGHGGPKDNPRSARLCHLAFSCGLWTASPRGCQLTLENIDWKRERFQVPNARLAMRLLIRSPE